MVNKADGSGSKIVYSGAAKSFDVKGEEIAAGKKTTRVNLSEKRSPTADIADSRMHVAAIVSFDGRDIGSKLMRGLIKAFTLHKFITVDLGPDTGRVLVNVNSLSERMHMPKSEILKAAQEGTLEQKIQGKLNILTKSLNSYDKAIRQYQCSKINTQELRSKQNAGKHFELTRKSLMHAIKETHAYFQKNPGITESHIPIKGLKFHVAKTGDDIHVMKRGRELGSGGEGIVTEVTVITAGCLGALKEAKNRQAAIESNRKEARLQAQLNPENKVPGLQTSAMVRLDKGFVGALYKGDAFDEHVGKESNLSVQERLKSGLEMMGALMYLARKGYAHLDIKPENIFVTGEGKMHIADLGGLVDLSKTSPFGRDPSDPLIDRNHPHETVAITPSYVSSTDMTALKKIVAMSPAYAANDSERKRIETAFQNAQLKMMTLAFGAALSTIITRSHPYQNANAKMDFIIPGTNDTSALLDQGVPKEVVAVIDKMLVSAFDQRPTIEQSFREMKKALIDTGVMSPDEAKALVNQFKEVMPDLPDDI